MSENKKNRNYASPYDWVENIDIRSNDYTVPSNIQVCELRCSIQGRIKIDTESSSSKTIYPSEGDVFRLKLTKVYKLGTNDGSPSTDYSGIDIRVNRIVLSGNRIA